MSGSAVSVHKAWRQRLSVFLPKRKMARLYDDQAPLPRYDCSQLPRPTTMSRLAAGLDKASRTDGDASAFTPYSPPVHIVPDVWQLGDVHESAAGEEHAPADDPLTVE